MDPGPWVCVTCLVEDHSLRLRPDLGPGHVVPHPGGNVEDGCRVEDGLAGQDWMFTEEEEEVSECLMSEMFHELPG